MGKVCDVAELELAILGIFGFFLYVDIFLGLWYQKKISLLTELGAPPLCDRTHQ